MVLTGAGPELSVVVIIASDTLRAVRCDTALLERCLESLNRQERAPSMEIIVPCHREVAVAGLESKYPEIRFLPITGLKTFRIEGRNREHHDELRKEGILAAKGRIVAFLEDNEVAHPQWARRMVDAHDRAVGAVGGAIEQADRGALNWAVYFCDFGAYQPPFEERDSPVVSDVNVSYTRAALDAVRAAWSDSYYEPAVHRALLDAGYRLVLTPVVLVYQRRGALGWSTALQERFIWGRSYGANQRRRGMPRLALHLLGFPLVPGVVLFRIARNVFRSGRAIREYVRSLPAIVVLVLSWSAGELVGYLTAQTHAHRS